MSLGYKDALESGIQRRLLFPGQHICSAHRLTCTSLLLRGTHAQDSGFQKETHLCWPRGCYVIVPIKVSLDFLVLARVSLQILAVSRYCGMH